jgi:protein-L-isoaspartate(D-aspartate) O-methyltransferase
MNQQTAADREGFGALMLRLRASGIAAPALVDALEATPRRGFVPSQWQDVCWSDRMIPIGCGETMEGTDLQASVIAALHVEPGHRVLEIGTGSGFTAAIFARMAARVVTVERFRTLAEDARRRLEALGIFNVLVKHADGSVGSPADAPFDRIVVWAAFDSLPRTFSDQLATNGIMIAPIGPAEGEQELAKLTKVGSRFDRHDIAHVRLQPIAPGVAAAL